MGLTAFEVLSFDCYGTLIDWDSGILRALDPLMSKASGRPSQEQLLQSFAIHECEQQIQTPGMVYSELLAAVHERLCRQWDIAAVEADHEAFGQSIGQWPAFPDSVAALQYLKQYYKLVILSNVDRRSFAYTNKSLEVEFDAIYIAEDIGSYYISPTLETLNISSRTSKTEASEKRICFTSPRVFSTITFPRRRSA